MIKYKQRALIVGLKSHTLTNKEKIFLKYSKPWGVILFSRNIINLNQLKRLTNNINDMDKSLSKLARAGFSYEISKKTLENI